MWRKDPQSPHLLNQFDSKKILLTRSWVVNQDKIGGSPTYVSFDPRSYAPTLPRPLHSIAGLSPAQAM